MSEIKIRFGLATKLVGSVVVVAAVIAVTLTMRATDQLADNLRANFASKGEAIALSLAAAVEQNAAAELSSVQGAVDSSKLIEGVRYIYVVEGGTNVVAVHTFSPSFPEGFDKTNVVEMGELGDKQRVKIAPRVEFATADTKIRAIDVAAPISGGALGTVHVGMDQEAIDKTVGSLLRSMALWGLVIALLGGGLGLAVVFWVVVLPISELTRATGAIVRTGDLAQKISVRHNDEIGVLAMTFGQLVAKLREIPISLQESAGKLSHAARELNSSAQEQSEMITRQAAALQETQVTAQEIKQTSIMAAQKAEAVLQVTARADEISQSGEQAIEQSLGGLQEIREQVEQIAAKISELSERTRQVGTITDSVKDLADQSNMLALNAAIEAVRSGEHGKGFSVVAREIRNLADQSIHSTNRVREILQDISDAIRVAVAITEKGSQKMEGGLVQIKASGENLRQLSNIVRENSAAVRQIAAAVSQQNAGISQIFTAVTDLSKMAENTVKRLEQTNVAAGAVTDASQQVTTVINSYKV